MNRADFQIDEHQDGQARLRLAGDWSTVAVGRLGDRLKTELDGRAVTALDLDDLGRFDTAGALALVQASSGRLPKGVWKERPEAGRIYQMIEVLERKSAPAPK